MMAFSLPKNTGVLLGKVSKKSVVKLYDGVKKGDGIRIGTGEEGFIVSSMSKNGKEVEYALKGEDVIIKPTPFAEGDILYKTSDISLLSELRKFYEKPFENKINIPLDVKFIPNSKLKLTAIFRNINFNVDGDIVEKPLNKPTSKEKLIENLSKSSETPIKFSPISIEYDEGFLPVSSINTSRREIADLIEKHLKIKREFLKLEINNGFSETKKLLPDVLVCVQNEIQLKAARELGFNSICMDIISNDIYYGVDYIKVPNIIKDEFETLCARIEKNLKSINGIVTSNAGIINRFKGKTKIIGDYKLNFFNSYSMGMYDKDLCGSCLSIELNKSEIAQVLEKNRNFFQVLLYGKPELMVSEYCLIGSVLGEKSKNKGCNKSCKNGSYVIKDRIGEEFSVISDNYCRTHIYNSLPINLISNVSELKKIGVNSFRLDFIDEGYEETINVLSSYKSGDGIVKNRNFTRGHFKRGVE